MSLWSENYPPYGYASAEQAIGPEEVKDAVIESLSRKGITLGPYDSVAVGVRGSKVFVNTYTSGKDVSKTFDSFDQALEFYKSGILVERSSGNATIVLLVGAMLWFALGK
jgi:hypothetical protein